MWKTFHGKPVPGSLSDAVALQIRDIRAAGREVKVCIGTDSLVRGEKVNFATALVFIVVGNGGYMFIHKRSGRNHMSLRERMMTEIGYSVETAYEISELLRDMDVPLEIHADINRDPKFPSHVSYQEAMGYIKAMGYIFVSKPDAFASSVCADRFTH